MPYTPDELVSLPIEVIALADAIRQARQAGSEGGVKVTRAERRRIVGLVAQLAISLARDGID